MTRPRRARPSLWSGRALVVLGLACAGVFPARVRTADAARPQDAVQPPAAAGQSGTRSVRDGVYSDVQAARGDKAFVARCAVCHKPEQFTGAFLDGWDGQTVNGLFALIRTSMPENDPGSLARQEYADIVAFLLKKNGLPAGPVDLPSAADGLKQITFGK